MKKGVEPGLLGLVGPFTRIARAMSKNYNVRIIPHGTRCETDGEVIYIPFTADELPEEMRQKLHGMLDHEVSHVAEERVAVEAGRKGAIHILNKVIPAETPKFPRRRQFMFNALEDIRIEAKYSKIYPGVAENLAFLNKQHVHDILKSYEENGEESKPNFWNCLGLSIILKARGYEVPRFLLDVLDGALDLVEDVIAEAPRAEWPEDALRLADEVIQRIKDFNEESSRGKKGDEDDKDDVGGDMIHEAETDGVASKMVETDATIDDVNREGAATFEKRVMDDAEEHGRYVPDPKAAALDRWVKPEGRVEYYRMISDEVRAQTNALRAKQLAILQTTSRAYLRSGLEEGELDGGMLPYLRTGETRVFGDVRRAKKINTAIEVLVDLSGSMGWPEHKGCCSYYAARTAVALAESWESLGVSHEWMGFYNGAPVSRTPEFVCRGPFVYYLFKGFDEKLKKVCGRFHAIRGYGDNADGEAVLTAASRLVVRPEPRKILVVISDGYPCHSGVELSKLNGHLSYAIRRASAAGLEVFGIGAGTDSVKRFYNAKNGAENIVVKDVSTLAVTVFQAMKSRLQRAA